MLRFRLRLYRDLHDVSTASNNIINQIKTTKNYGL